MRLPATKTLVKVAVYGGVICISTVMYARSTVEDRVRQSDHFRAAMKTLRTHQGAVQLLGEPIKEKGFDLGDPMRNFCTDRLAQFEVKVVGPKDKGTMFFWAERPGEKCAEATVDDRNWHVSRLELEVNSIPDRRLVVKRPAETALGNEEKLPMDTAAVA